MAEILIKMKEMKQPAVTAFSEFINDEFAVQMFADCFDLWENSDCRYNTDNRAYVAVIRRFVPSIRTRLSRIDFILSKTEPNKKTITTDTKTSTEVNIGQKDEITTNNTNSSSTDGASKAVNYVYPSGYTGTTDRGFISTESTTDVVTNSNTSDVRLEKKDNVNDKKNINSDGFLTVEEIDNSIKMQAINDDIELSNLIENCVFAFLANTTYGAIYGYSNFI